MLLIHLSDIHFKAATVGQPDDPNGGLRSDLLEDVRYMCSSIGRSADCILISGDIAYAGLEADEEFASNILSCEQVQTSVRIDLSSSWAYTEATPCVQ